MLFYNRHLVTGNPTESKTAFDVRFGDLPHCEMKGMDQVQSGGITFDNTHLATYWALGQNGSVHIWDISRLLTPLRVLLQCERGDVVADFNISPDS